MRVEKIGPEHARSLGRLEAEIYPPNFCLGWQDFLGDLEEAEREGANLSFGLFFEGQIVGYIVAYIEDSDIFISDLAILPKHRARLVRLLSVFLEAAAKTGLHIVAECRESSFRVCKHSEFFQQFGYTLTQQEQVAAHCDEPSWAVKLEMGA